MTSHLFIMISHSFSAMSLLHHYVILWQPQLLTHHLLTTVLHTTPCCFIVKTRLVVVPLSQGQHSSASLIRIQSPSVKHNNATMPVSTAAKTSRKRRARAWAPVTDPRPWCRPWPCTLYFWWPAQPHSLKVAPSSGTGPEERQRSKMVFYITITIIIVIFRAPQLANTGENTVPYKINKNCMHHACHARTQADCPILLPSATVFFFFGGGGFSKTKSWKLHYLYRYYYYYYNIKCNIMWKNIYKGPTPNVSRSA